MRNGVTDSNKPECELKKYMLRQANKVILLADHTKFDKSISTQPKYWFHFIKVSL
ncbi:hypothetical protein [Paenibacillus wynnii]|uniref:hypothetical protein n=1 Tax=Paenibacillus wynnii TaxID=268407 RepID=UPI0035930BA5